MSLSSGRAMLNDAAAELKAAWRRAREDWDDETAEAFEKEFLEPLAGVLRATVSAMDELMVENDRARRECG